MLEQGVPEFIFTQMDKYNDPDAVPIQYFAALTLALLTQGIVKFILSNLFQIGIQLF